MLPKEVQRCIFSLRNAGYEAYAVGGCVRDLLLGLPIHDFDVTTSAQPETVMAIFEKTIPTGLAHGTVTVRINHQSIEVTTFRSDGAYADGRHPNAVRFDTDLTGDLSRRDFTINAMAMDENDRIVDPFDGQGDLKRRLLRAVGDPQRRFSEDGLRILRGVRFSARLGFDIEPGTWEAMVNCCSMLKRVSAERIREELFGILLGSHPTLGNRIFSLDLFHGRGDLTEFSHYPQEILPRFAGFCRQLGDSELPKRFKCDRKTISAIAHAAKLAATPTNSDSQWRAVIAYHGEQTALALAGWLGTFNDFFRVREQIFPRSVNELALSSADLAALGYTGEELGAAQKKLLAAVLEAPERNTAAILKALL